MFNPNLFLKSPPSSFPPSYPPSQFQTHQLRNNNNHPHNYFVGPQVPRSLEHIHTDRYNIHTLSSTLFQPYSQPSSYWDEPLKIPAVLYRKFKVPIPPELMPMVSTSHQNVKEYPPALLEYIKKCYERCSSEMDNKRMESTLRMIIQSAANRIHEVNWAQFEVPSLPKTSQVSLSNNNLNSNNNPSTSAPNNTLTSGSSYRTPMVIQPQRPMTVQQLRKLQSQQPPQTNQQQSPPTVAPASQPITIPAKPSVLTSASTTLANNSVLKSTHKGVEEALQKLQQHQNSKISSTQQPKISSISNMNPSTLHEKMLKGELKQIKITEKAKQTAAKASEDLDTMAKRVERINRFGAATALPAPPGKPNANKKKIMDNDDDVNQDFDFEKMADQWKIVGTSKQLQKKYLRITSMPDPSTVRPEPVLRKVLAMLLQKYKQGESYEYIIQQFRSLRQDLTIQHIKNAFTVQVYEENSKISLYSDDMGQFHQCQSSLWDLYRNGIYRDVVIMNRFIGYQLITLVMEQKYQQLEYILTQLSTVQLESSQVQAVLRMHRQLKMGNYVAFFRFYERMDSLSKSLINQYIDKIRAMCLAMVSKTFGEKVKLDVLSESLGDDEDLLQQLITEVGGKVSEGYFLLKASHDKIKNCEYLAQKKKHVFV